MPSIIGADLKIVGNLVCEGDIDVQGEVEGDIEAKTVTVDKGANIAGSIRARSLIVSGAVDGSLEAATVSLTSTAKVTGELLHETLSVDPGASLEAQLSRTGKEKRIAAQIPKPKLDLSELETPVPKTVEAEPPATKTDAPKTPSEGGSEEEPLVLETRDIPEAFDRRKKQAAG